MSYYIGRLERPYDSRRLIEAFVCSRRSDFLHQDFTDYYTRLSRTLQAQFNVVLSAEGLTFDQHVLWRLFEHTIDSLLQITSPWSGYLEDTLLTVKIQKLPDQGAAIWACRDRISAANDENTKAHWELLHALFVAIFGERLGVFTSADLAAVGFDDSKEPDASDYWEYA